MSFLAGINAADPVRVAMNVETILDNYTGRYFKGVYNDYVLSGGLSQSMLITGRGNTIKTGTGIAFTARALDRYPTSCCAHEDTEDSAMGPSRMEELVQGVAPRLVENGTLWDQTRYIVTDSSSKDAKGWSTAKWFDIISDKLRVRSKKNTNADYITTPFTDPTQPNAKVRIKILHPVIPFLDSISKANLDAIEGIKEKTSIDSSDQNALALRENLYKHRLIGQIPRLAATGSSYWIITAHMGDKINMNPMETPEKKLAFISSKVAFKGVPESATFLSNLILYSNHLKPLTEGTGAARVPMYPFDSAEFTFKDQDLLELHMMTLRSKVGRTGVEWTYVVSQSSGFDFPLSHFHVLKNYKWGFDGLGGQWLNLKLYPECKLSRTTVRVKVLTDAKLVRALEITMGFLIRLQVDEKFKMYYQKTIGKDGLGSLIDKVNKLGFVTWDEILQTRGYWTDDHYENPIRYISDIDIMRMVLGEYVPYWVQMEREKKGSGKKAKSKALGLDSILLGSDIDLDAEVNIDELLKGYVPEEV